MSFDETFVVGDRYLPGHASHGFDYETVFSNLDGQPAQNIQERERERLAVELGEILRWCTAPTNVRTVGLRVIAVVELLAPDLLAGSKLYRKRWFRRRRLYGLQKTIREARRFLVALRRSNVPTESASDRPDDRSAIPSRPSAETRQKAMPERNPPPPHPGGSKESFISPTRRAGRQSALQTRASR